MVKTMLIKNSTQNFGTRAFIHTNNYNQAKELFGIVKMIKKEYPQISNANFNAMDDKLVIFTNGDADMMDLLIPLTAGKIKERPKEIVENFLKNPVIELHHIDYKV